MTDKIPWIEIKPGKLPDKYEPYSKDFLVKTNIEVNGESFSIAFIDSFKNWCVDTDYGLSQYLQLENHEVTHYAIITEPDK